MRESPRLFTSYHLPLPRRRQGPAAALALAGHVALAAVLLWRGAVLLGPGAGGEGPRGAGGGSGGRRAVTWFSLPTAPAPPAVDMPALPPVVPPPLTLPDPVTIDVPAVQLAAPPAATPAAAASSTGVTGGQGPGSGGGQGTGTGPGTGADAGPGSGGEGGYFPADANGVIVPPACARGEFMVRFWVEVDGRVSRVEVDPLPKDAGCRRQMIETLKAYRFKPARTRDGRPIASIYPFKVIH